MNNIEQVFRTPPQEIKLSEGVNGPESIPTKVQLMRTCTFFHKKYGKVQITRKLFSDMIDNFKKGVRRIDCSIDYAHDSEREAAGWIKDLEIIDNQERGESELWAIVDWTKSGTMSLSDKEFRYLSADFDMNYEDNETPGLKRGPVLLGAGLTNRPVIKGMKAITAIQLSELSKENDMNEEDVKKLEQLQKLMTELGCNSVEEVMAKIAEMKSQNASLTEEKVLAEKKEATNRLFSEGKITKAQVDKALTLPKDTFDSFIQLAEMNEGIKNKEEGHSGSASGTTEKVNAQDKVIELAEKKAQDEKLDIGTAISLVLSENPELKKGYNAETGGDEIEVSDEE